MTTQPRSGADGSTWTSVYGPVSGNVDLAWAKKSVVLSPSYASNRFQVRFRLWSNGCRTGLPGLYVDDIALQTANLPCEAVTGGLVVGHVTDVRTSQGCMAPS